MHTLIPIRTYAPTTPTNVDSSIPEVWAKDAFRRVKVAGYFGKFIGRPGSGAPIIQKTELLGKPGDLIHIQVTDPLTGAGQTGDTSMVEGNEENLATSEIKTSPVFYRHGVANYRRAGKKSLIDLRTEARFRLEEWAQNKIDNLRWAAFTGTTPPVAGEVYTPNKMILATTDGADVGTVVGDSVDDLIATDGLTVKGIQMVKLKLRLQQARPLMIDGKPHYILVTHPNSTFLLKQETRYESWVREAAVRGESNPMFQGALAVIDGVILHDHENVPTANNATAIKYAMGLAFGAEAFVEAADEDVGAVEEQFDYGNKLGYEIHFAFQPRRALELSSLQVVTSAKDQV